MCKYVEVDLYKEQKQAILKYAGFFVFDKQTKSDLNNSRKKWIRFDAHELSEIIGELSYHFNRCKSDSQFYLLDELISHLEFSESENR